MMTLYSDAYTGIISCMHPANDRHYIVTSSFVGWAHTQNDPWLYKALGGVELMAKSIIIQR